MAVLFQMDAFLVLKKIFKSPAMRRLSLRPFQQLLSTSVDNMTSAPVISSFDVLHRTPESRLFGSPAMAFSKGFPRQLSYSHACSFPRQHGSCCLPYSHARSFHISTCYESASSILSDSRSQIFIHTLVNDYVIVLEELQKKKKELERQTKTQKKPVCKIKDFRLIKFFGLPPTAPKKVSQGPRLKYQQAIYRNNDTFRALYDSAEFELLLSVCQNPENQEYLESKLSLNVSSVKELVDELQTMRKEFIENFKIEDGRKRPFERDVITFWPKSSDNKKL